MATGDAPAERATLADEMLLADELGEAPRAHPGSQRLALGRGLEEGLGTGAAGLRAGSGHGSMVRATGAVARRIRG